MSTSYIVSMCITTYLSHIDNAIGLVGMIAAVAGCFSALKSSQKNLPIVFPINREISLFCGHSTWKLCELLVFFTYTKLLVRTETRTRERKFVQSI